MELQKINLQNTPESSKDIPHRNILNADFDTETQVLKLSYLYKSKKRHSLKLFIIEGAIEESDNTKVSQWVDTLMNAAYAGESPF